MATHFEDKYEECRRVQYFPGLTKRVPESLRPEDVPVIACAECIARSAGEGRQQVVCPHMPKISFFYNVTATFKLVFKRPGSDQCEKYNSLNDRILLLRAQGRLDDADNLEDRRKTSLSITTGRQHSVT